MKTMKLTLMGKVVVFLLIVSLVSVPTYMLGGFDELQKMFEKDSQAMPMGNTDNTSSESKNKGEASKAKSSKVLKLSLDEWIGWKSIIDANGGLETKKGSIYDQLGLKVSIVIINDAALSSNALIKGDINAAGYTVNRYAFLNEKFKSANVKVVMPYITNSSTGGDGIIAKHEINRIEDLVGKKIGVPRFSEAQTLVEWLLNKSSLTAEQADQIRKDMVFFETPDDAAKAFFGGRLDAAATWQPYLSQAQETTGARVLFSTKAATNIILDGIVFRKDFIDSNKDTVLKFIEGTLKAESLYKTEFDAIRESMPLFTTETDKSILAMTEDATLSNYASNKELLNGVAQNLFRDMSQIWKQLGEKAEPGDADKAFDLTFILALNNQDTTAKAQKPKFTEEQREKAKNQDNLQALLKTTLTIKFEPNLAVIREESYESLNEFAEIGSILNGAIIQIEGNVADVGTPNPEVEKKLSFERAKAVATYLQVQGVDSSRFVILGNGISKQIGDNNTKEGQEMNRRTDIFFKVVE